MKKLNRKGFTLIELLAVITILGILMLVAIPAVSRTIENSRRDTFADLGTTYIRTVRNAVIADELTCDGKNASATTAGTYYFKISTVDGDSGFQQTTDIMEKSGKSSWGKNDVRGYVKWVKEAKTGDTESGFTTTYSIYLVDSGLHGIDVEKEEKDVIRSNVKVKATVENDNFANVLQAPTSGTECTLNK